MRECLLTVSLMLLSQSDEMLMHLPSYIAEIHVQLIPINAQSLKNDTVPQFAAITTAILQLPSEPELTGGHVGSLPASQDIKPWISAFIKCAQDTLQLLSCPGPRKAIPTEKSQDALMAVSSLVSSGLPIPKSPSGHMPELLARHLPPLAEYQTRGDEVRELEREERGWWLIRYRQVLGEIVHCTPS